MNNLLKLSINYTYYPNYFTNGKLNENFFYNMDNFLSEVLDDCRCYLFKTKLVRNLNINNITPEIKHVCLELKLNREIKYFIFDAEINKSVFKKSLNEDYIVYVYFGCHVKNSKVVFKEEYDKYINKKEQETI
jgi:hypothetical protein